MATEWIVGIAGASGSGKSSLAANLVSRLEGEPGGPETFVLSEDAYYRSRTDLTLQQRSEVNYDHPDVFEHSLLLQHLRQLRAGAPVDVPQYDYATHRVDRGLDGRGKPNRVVGSDKVIVDRSRATDNLTIPESGQGNGPLKRPITSNGNQAVDSVAPQYFSRFLLSCL